MPVRSVWRIVSARHAGHAFDGEGARLYGGRFNHPGTAVVYTSSHLSLAALELLVHLDPDLVPDDLVALAGELPEGLEIPRLTVPELPPDWRRYPGPESLRDLGTAWARSAESLALEVPSAVIPQETNVLLNPAHPDFRRLSVGGPEPFAFDPRMWR